MNIFRTLLMGAVVSIATLTVHAAGDAYYVTIAAGGTFTFWEFNLRFKTDSSELGPEKGKPAILRASMRGDRAFIIFSDPAEISAFIQEQC